MFKEKYNNKDNLLMYFMNFFNYKITGESVFANILEVGKTF